jgi:hypothetical protein
MLAEAETILGVKLPLELIALLRVQNGGYTQGFAHPMSQRTTWANDHVPLDDLAGIVLDPRIETPLNIVSAEYMAQEWALPPQQVPLSGDGHYWITLDYRRSPTPSVAWIDVECAEDLHVAETFAAFLAGLVPASDYDAA